MIGAVNYLIFRNGVPKRAYFADDQGDEAIDAVIASFWPVGGPAPTVRAANVEAVMGPTGIPTR